jgi:hypothetical protein
MNMCRKALMGTPDWKLFLQLKFKSRLKRPPSRCGRRKE